MSSNQEISSAMFNALSLKYQAQYEEARSTLLVYFNKNLNNFTFLRHSNIYLNN